MKKVAVVYWSGTGNTEAMATAVAEGAKAAGAEVTVMTSATFTPDKVDEFDSIAFGCPSMGDEVLEETEFDPMFTECESKLSGKPIALFGPTDGAAVNGWNPGRNVPKMTTHHWYVKALSATKCRMMKDWNSAGLWEKHWSSHT